MLKFNFGLRFDQFLSLFCWSLILLTQGMIKVVAKQLPPKQIITLIQPAPMPVWINSEIARQTDLQKISAQAFIVADLDSGAVLLAKNENLRMYPASTTKMMTALVALKHFTSDQLITIPQLVNNNDKTINVSPGEQWLFKDVLAGLLIESDNYLAYVLASNVSNSTTDYQVFVDEMNAQAKEWQLDSTHFTNPAGYDDEQHRSTARDLLILARILLTNRLLTAIVATKQAQISDVNQRYQHTLNNTNLLLGTESGVKGIKTGTTSLAHEVLVTLVERDGHQLILVVMGSLDRYQDTKDLINLVFSNVKWQAVDLSKASLFARDFVE